MGATGTNTVILSNNYCHLTYLFYLINIDLKPVGKFFSLMKTFFNKKMDKVVLLFLSIIITVIVALIVARTNFSNRSKGATDEYSKSFEAESMTVTGDIKIIDDQTVSGAKYIQF